MLPENLILKAKSQEPNLKQTLITIMATQQQFFC